MKFKEAYVNPSSPTFGNALRSALEAGYEETYAVNITAQGNEWFCEILRDFEMVDSAEKALKDTIEMDVINEKGRLDAGLVKARSEMVKFALPNLKPEKWDKKKGGEQGVIPVNLEVTFQHGNPDTTSSTAS